MLINLTFEFHKNKMVLSASSNRKKYLNKIKMRSNKIIINKAKNNELYVTVKGTNNKIIATTETYKRMQGAKNAAKALKKVVKNAVVVDKTKRG